MIERYRMMLFSDGEEVFTDRPESGEINQRVRKGFKRKQVKKVLASGGKLTFGDESKTASVVLYARYLKRIASHLTNITTTNICCTSSR